MKRREFISLIGGAAAAWPLVARAQQPAMPVIGFLGPTSAAVFADRLRGFQRGVQVGNFVEGENLTIAYRWAEGRFDRLPTLAAELVSRAVAVIVTGATSAAFAAKAATTTIPITFITPEDPVGLGLVASLARPGGNMTGVNLLSSEVTAKRLELLRALLPAARRVVVLVNPADATTTESTLRDVEAAAPAVGLDTHVARARTAGEIDAAFAAFAQEWPDALFVGADPFFTSRRVQLANLASRHALPMTSATLPMPGARSASTSHGCSRAPRPPTCRSCRRRSSSSSSMRRPRARSASKCHRRSLPAPTR